MEVWAVQLDTPVQFTAYILQGDLEGGDRTWVCVRAAESSPAVSWLGCWSRGQASTADVVRQLLQGVERSIGNPVQIGPFGPMIGKLEFFEGWDSWGIGTPRPIAGFRPWESLAGILEKVPGDSLRFPYGGFKIHG